MSKNELIENEYPIHVPERLLDAHVLSFDLPEVIENLKKEDIWKTGDRNAITLLKSSCMRILLIALHEHAEINFHQAGDVISVQLIEGNIHFQTENQSVMLKKGGLITLHQGLNHTLTAVEESVFLLTIAICPVDEKPL
jgi:quercetin dioxygenase-like cupin family protein